MLLSNCSPSGTGINSRPPRHWIQHDWWLLLLVKCHGHRRLFLLLPVFHKEKLKYFTWPIWGNGRKQMKFLTHSAPCTKWLNYADDMLRFIGLLQHRGCGWAGPDLGRIKRLLCVWGWTEKCIKKGIWNWNQMCAWMSSCVCVYARSACFKDVCPCNCLACDFFFRVCGFQRGTSSTIRERK